MTLLLTGATGFVGINLLEALLGQGRRVVAFADRPLPDQAMQQVAGLPGELICTTGDIRDKLTLKAVMAAANVTNVLHAAVITSNRQREHDQGDVVVSVNIAGTAAITQAAAEHGVERCLMVGSLAAFGQVPMRDTAKLDEDTPQNPTSLYEIGKSASETIAKRMADLHGMDLVIGRLGTVFGPWEHASGVRDTLSAVHQVMQAARAGKQICLPRPAIKNWHYSRQAAASLITLLDAPKTAHRTYNLGPEQSWTLAAWCQLLKTRYPDFDYTIETGPGEPINLYEPLDNADLSGDRFRAEFGKAHEFDLEQSFADYVAWSEQLKGWGIDAR